MGKVIKFKSNFISEDQREKQQHKQNMKQLRMLLYKLKMTDDKRVIEKLKKEQ